MVTQRSNLQLAVVVVAQITLLLSVVWGTDVLIPKPVFTLIAYLPSYLFLDLFMAILLLSGCVGVLFFTVTLSSQSAVWAFSEYL